MKVLARYWSMNWKNWPKRGNCHPTKLNIMTADAAMYLLHTIAERKKVILIDCCLMGTDPGTIRRFTPDDVNSVKKMAHLSLHEVDILKVIELAKKIGQCPDDIVILGIEPVAIEQQMYLNETLQKRIPEYIEVIRAELDPIPEKS